MQELKDFSLHCFITQAAETGHGRIAYKTRKASRRWGFPRSPGSPPLNGCNEATVTATNSLNIQHTSQWGHSLPQVDLIVRSPSLTVTELFLLMPRRIPQQQSFLSFYLGPGLLTSSSPDSCAVGFSSQPVQDKTNPHPGSCHSRLLCIRVTDQPLLFIRVPRSEWANVTMSPVLNDGLFFWRFTVSAVVFVCFVGLWLSLEQARLLAKQRRKQLVLSTSLSLSLLHLSYSFCSILDQKDPKWTCPIPGGPWVANALIPK